jgi:hypothetical protein
VLQTAEANENKALLLSVSHLSMFIYLDNKPISIYRQSYVTTASTILASAFCLSVQVALGVAFTQKLWNILRKSPQTVRATERLFQMRGNLFSIFNFTTIRSAPLLVIIVAVVWGLQIATTFPPGALTIVQRSQEMTESRTVTTLNLSFVKGTGVANTIDVAIC